MVGFAEGPMTPRGAMRVARIVRTRTAKGRNDVVLGRRYYRYPDHPGHHLRPPPGPLGDNSPEHPSSGTSWGSVRVLTVKDASGS